MNTLHRLSIMLLKYVPMIGGFLMWVHVTLLLLNIQTHVFENVVGYSVAPSVTMLVWSKTFNFCPIHRCFICYNTAVMGCIKWQANFIGFGSALLVVRLIVWIIGLGLLIWFAMTHEDIKLWKTNYG